MSPGAVQGNLPTRWRRAAGWMAWGCVVVSAAVFARRGLAAAEAADVAPGVAVTSGFEEESFFALWRAAHGQAIYTEATRQPYAAAYFNWLFYAGYRGPVAAAMRTGGDAAIPRAARLVTAAGALLGCGMLGWLLWRVLPGYPAAAAGLASFVFFGPLVGWWAHSVRPDAWALALECAALAGLLSLYRERPVAAALLACLLFYGAWSFKQTYVLGLGSAGLFLLLRRQWRTFALLLAGSVALWAVTFIAGGEAYRAAFRATLVTNVYFLAHGLGNLHELLLKGAPLLLIAGWLVGRRRVPEPPASFAADACLLGGAGFLLSFSLAFIASCKIGAFSNHFFTPQLMLAILAGGLIATRESNLAALAGFGAACAMQLAIAFGVIGHADLRPQTRELARVWATWHQEPEPRFSALTGLNLPWLNPGSPPLVLAYNYELDRRAGKAFEADGVGGLVEAGYFRSLLLPAETRQSYDGGSLQQYVRTNTVGQLAVFRRRDSLNP